MISDTVDRLPLYEALIPEAGKIARAFQSKVPSDVSCEVREKSYALKEDTARRFEVHFHTIDLMIAREGAETIHICPMEQLTPAEALPNGGDGCKMTGEPQGLAHVLSVKHVEEAASAVDIKLSDDEIAALEAPYVAHTKQHAF